VDDAAYLSECGGFHRRNIRYLPSNPADAKPLVEGLPFIRNKSAWGMVCCYGMIEICEKSYKTIPTAMNVNDLAE
jgi:hypothetical protein